MLAHRLGVNAFFCALAEVSRAHDGHCLSTWQPEHWVRRRAPRSSPTGSDGTCTPAGPASSTWSTTGAPRRSARSRESSRATCGSRRGGRRTRISAGFRTSSWSSRGGARGGGRLGPSSCDREPSRPCVARVVVPTVRGGRGSSQRVRRPRASVEAPGYGPRASHACRPSFRGGRPLSEHPVSRPVLDGRRCRPAGSDRSRLLSSAVPGPHSRREPDPGGEPVTGRGQPEDTSREAVDRPLLQTARGTLDTPGSLRVTVRIEPMTEERQVLFMADLLDILGRGQGAPGFAASALCTRLGRHD